MGKAGSKDHIIKLKSEGFAIFRHLLWEWKMTQALWKIMYPYISVVTPCSEMLFVFKRCSGKLSLFLHPQENHKHHLGHLDCLQIHFERIIRIAIASIEGKQLLKSYCSKSFSSIKKSIIWA